MKIPHQTRAVLFCGLAVLLSSNVTAQEKKYETDLPPTPRLDNSLSNRERVELEYKDYKADWREAAQTAGKLANRLRSHIVRLNDDNTLKGRITTIASAKGDMNPIRNVNIKFIREGRIRATVRPKADGSFVARSLEPGVYSMIANGKDGFLAWAVNVQPSLRDIAKLPKTQRTVFLSQQATRSLEVQTSAVPPSDFKPLKQLMRTQLPRNAGAVYLESTDVPEDMMNQPPGSAKLGTSLRHHQVRLTDDGRLVGRVRRLQSESGRDLRITQLNVYLLRGESVVSQEEVLPNGTFSFDALKPGVYSLVAAGRDGFLAFSIDVLRAKREAAAVNGYSPVGFKLAQDPAFQIDAALCQPCDVNLLNVVPHTDSFPFDDGAMMADMPIQDFGAPMADAPFYGGGAPAFGGSGVISGGAAAGGTGGGLGAILLGTGAGIGAATLFDDDDDGRRRASPGSPGN